MRRAEDSEVDGPDAYLCQIPRSREVKQSYLTSIWTTLVAFWACFPLIWRERPRVILANGPGTCLPVCVVAWLLATLRLVPKCDIVFIESAARVHRLSLSGWLLLRLRLCALFVVQWPELAEAYASATLVSLFF
jgi:beta-1,4-N-acetylglucosaminyltransferase